MEKKARAHSLSFSLFFTFPFGIPVGASAKERVFYALLAVLNKYYKKVYRYFLKYVNFCLRQRCFNLCFLYNIPKIFVIATVCTTIKKWATRF